MENDYSEGQFVPGKGIALPTGGFRQPTTAELKSLFPTADPDLFKLVDAGVFNTNQTTNVPEELNYGAGGRGEDAYDPIIEEGIKKGVPTSELGDYSQNPKGYKLPSVGQFEAAGIAKAYGLSGTNIENRLIGLSTQGALELAQQENLKRRGQISSRTSYNYNPKSIAGFRDAFKDLKFKIDENKNEPWLDRTAKKQKQEAIINSYTKQLAGLFNTPEEFLNAQQDEEFQRTLKDYERLGGSRNAIAANIGQGEVTVVNEVDNPDGTTTVTYSDGETRNVRYQQNPDGTLTPIFQDSGNQTIDQYLGAMDTKSKQMAIESLIPEKKIAQDQIAFEQSIPEAYKEYYFGSEETIGLLQRQKSEAEESIKLLERQARNQEQSAKAQADLLTQKNDFELQKTEAEIEENRLTARNYMVGQLAKLGALKTTGKAPEALANLEQKYQKQAQQLRTTYQLENQDLKIQLRDKMAEIALNRDTDVLKIKQDLTKNEEDVWKEIFKLQVNAQREEFKIVDNFARDFRSRNDKYTTELKKEAEKYAKDLAKAASQYNVKLTFEKFIQEKQEDLQRTIRPEDYARYRSEYQSVVKQRKAEASAGIPSDLLTTTETEVQDALQDAADMISQRVEGGEDRDAVFQEIKQTFLDYYPEYSTEFNSYVGTKKGIDVSEE